MNNVEVVARMNSFLSSHGIASSSHVVAGFSRF
jgi:hypothetical protein